MRPKNNDKPQPNPTRPDRTLKKRRSSHSQQEHSLLRIQSKISVQRKVILQVAQDVIILTVYGHRDKYGAAKGIVKTAQLVYPWITRYQVYANMRLLKQLGREHESLEHGAPPVSGRGATRGATSSND